MRQRLTLTLLVFAVVVYPVVALGADAKTSATSELLTWLLGLVASIVLVLIQQAIKKWLAPKVSKETADLLEKLAAAGVAYAEEKGRVSVKGLGQKMEGSEKLERASTFALAEAEKFGVKDLDLERIRKYVETALNRSREASPCLASAPVPMDTNGKVRGV